MNRRAFIFGITLLPLAALPAPAVMDSRGDEFMNGVRDKVVEIVCREGRALRNFEIRAPHMVDGVMCRQCILQIAPGGSLLDRCYFVWDEPYSA